MTVGTGISPVPALAAKAAAARGLTTKTPERLADHRRWGLSPRPESSI
jgi:hypothetical protein